jgi:hypothetical protein
MVGSKAATIPAGPGRRSATVTLDASETGHVTVRLQPASACTFKRVKLEAGAYATPWVATPVEIEELRCRRYYLWLATSAGAPALLGILGQRVGANAIDFAFTLPVSMRADPTILTSNFAWANTSPVGNQVGFYNNASAAWAALSGALTVTAASPITPACVILRLQAGSSFSGLAGGVGYLHMGTSASIALYAEL